MARKTIQISKQLPSKMYWSVANMNMKSTQKEPTQFNSKGSSQAKAKIVDPRV